MQPKDSAYGIWDVRTFLGRPWDVVCCPGIVAGIVAVSDVVDVRSGRGDGEGEGGKKSKKLPSISNF